MRIVVVSAHYPPNFVSGGTLQPQRLARGLHARGHDVRVYAGWLGERPAGTSWSEVDETGLPVRWIVTSPWIGWDERRNFDNPAVTSDFRAFVAQVDPDVVHFHALQSLGAGLLRPALAAGAATVVTMHDFWWCCARQFLVDRELRPCSLVVDAGSCACSVDAPWLHERNRWLRHALADARLVLAPSQSAAAVLAANGVAAERLEVDENGMTEASDPPVVAPRGPSSGDDVRFVYAGGANEMKGIATLADACRSMAERPGWCLRAYGIEEWTATHPGRFGMAPVDAFPPFAPEEAEAVFADADVLVLPSIMRESHSLITREALTRGVAVLCSDCLGPEEVVRDGVNGIVVPTGDASALGEAMGRLIDDRALLAKLRDHPPAGPLRSLEDQLDGLERRYDRLVAAPVPRERRRRRAPRIRRVLFVVGIEGAPLRYRARLPAEALDLLGVRSDIRWLTDPDLPRLARRADAVVAYRVPATDWVLGVLAAVQRRGTPVLFDADDLIFDPALAHEIPALRILPDDLAAHWLEGVHRYRTVMEHADGFVASTDALATHAHELVGLPTERFDNGVGMLIARASERALRRPRSPGPLRIGYLSGTDTHDRDLAMLEEPLAALLGRWPDVELWLGGPLPPAPALDRFADRVRRIPFRPWLEVPQILRDIDVNLAPLEPVRFNEAKSAIKWLEAALVETPTVASPTQPFRDAIQPGENGLLAASPAEWAEAIELLLDDERGRARLGRRAHRDALLRWSPHVQGRRYLDILERAAARTERERPARAGGWTPVVVPEAPRRYAVEPYEDPNGAVWPRRRREPADRIEPAREASRRVTSIVREEGWSALGTRAVRVVRRGFRPRTR